MRLISRQTRLNNFLDEWGAIGSNNGEYCKMLDAEISALPPNPTPDDVKGTELRFFVANICGHCFSAVDVLVQLGEPLDDGSSTADICLDCLQKAIALINQQTEERLNQ